MNKVIDVAVSFGALTLVDHHKRRALLDARHEVGAVNLLQKQQQP